MSEETKQTGMLVDGVFASEAIDSSGEILDVEGMDISTFDEGRGLANWEHLGPESKGFGQEIVGKVVYAKKILKRDDCSSDRERLFWDRTKLPFLYGVVRLYDGAGHEGAKSLAASIRDSVANNEPIVLGFSIEGSTLERQGNRLKSTVARLVAITAKPCNKQAVTGVLSDPNAPEGFSKDPEKTEKSEIVDPAKIRLGGSETEYSTDMLKALTAGSYNSAPGTLTGGAALQVEDRTLKAMAKAAQRDWDKTGRFRDYLKKYLDKAEMGDVSDEFLDHYSDIVEAHTFRVKKAQEILGSLKKAAKKVTVLSGRGIDSAGFTDNGEPVSPNPDLEGPVFDHESGELRIPQGTFKVYVPSRDEKHISDSFHEILTDPKVEHFHNEAMGNWIKAHRLFKAGRTPPELAMHAVLFSNLSPNTPVPVQELMFGHLIDSMRSKGGTPLQPKRWANIRADWLDRDQPSKFPDHSPDHWKRLEDLLRLKRRSKTTGREAGEISSFMLANNKWKNMSKYRDMHSDLMNLLSEKKGDARSAVSDMMFHKIEKEKWDAKKQRDPSIGEYPHLKVAGLAPKTARYAIAMMGGGNIHVPDTHFVRNLFGLNREKDSKSINTIKNLLWNERNSNILDSIDKYYAQHHDAVKHILSHPIWGKEFLNPEDAIFPAFWKHWMSIVPHEKVRGHDVSSFNELTDHKPFWDAVAPSLNKSEVDAAQPLAVKTARQHADWEQQYGQIPAMMLFCRYLLPQLIESNAEKNAAQLVRKAQELQVDFLAKEQSMDTIHKIANKVNALKDIGLTSNDPQMKRTLAVAQDRSEATPITFQGKRVVPGMMWDTRNSDVNGGGTQKWHVLHADATHFYALPEHKHPDAGWTADDLVKIPREPNLNVERWPQNVDSSSVVDVDRDGVDLFVNHPETRALAHGFDFEDKTAQETYGAAARHSFWARAADGRSVYVKAAAPNWIARDHYEGPWNSARREGIYYNIARDYFGLGDFLPHVAVVRHPKTGREHAIIEHVPGSEAAAANKRKLQEAVENHGSDIVKLGIMNTVMGNNDRHDGNYIVTPDNKIKLIDHNLFGHSGSTAMDPHYLNVNEKLYKEPISPEVAKWLISLDPAQLQAQLMRHGMPLKSIAAAHQRLQYLQTHALHDKENLQDALENACLSIDGTRKLPDLLQKENAPHPHDNEVWSENLHLNDPFLDPNLQKGKKDGLAMYKPEDPGFPEAKDFVNWAYSTFPQENWSLWAIRHHKKAPADFTPEIKAQLQQYAAAATPAAREIAELRFDKSHDLRQGLNLLHQAQERYLTRVKAGLKLVDKTPETAKKIVDVGSDGSWWDLGQKSCSHEGAAMGHCGNAGEPTENDRVLSFRKEYTFAGKKYYEPAMTFIQNNRVIGEMKGRGNLKPHPKYHKAILKLINEQDLLPVGGGYKPEANFSISDLSPELHGQLSDNLKKALSDKNYALQNYPYGDASKFEKQKRMDRWWIQNGVLSIEEQRQLWDQTRNNAGYYAGPLHDLILSNRNLDPSIHKEMKDSFRATTAHERQSRDAGFARREGVFDYFLSNPLTQTSDLTELLNPSFGNSGIKKIATSPKADAGIVKAILTQKDPQTGFVYPEDCRASAATSLAVSPEVLSQVLTDPGEDEEVQVSAIQNKRATPTHISQALATNRPYVQSAAMAHPNVTPEHIQYVLDMPQNRNNSDLIIAAGSNSKATPEQVTQVLTRVPRSAETILEKNKNLKPEHIQAIVDGVVTGTNPVDRFRMRDLTTGLLSSPHFNAQHFKSIVAARPNETYSMFNKNIENANRVDAFVQQDPSIAKLALHATARNDHYLLSDVMDRFSGALQSKDMAEVMMNHDGGLDVVNALPHTTKLDPEDLKAVWDFHKDNSRNSYRHEEAMANLIANHGATPDFLKSALRVKEQLAEGNHTYGIINNAILSHPSMDPQALHEVAEMALAHKPSSSAYRQDIHLAQSILNNKNITKQTVDMLASTDDAHIAALAATHHHADPQHVESAINKLLLRPNDYHTADRLKVIAERSPSLLPDHVHKLLDESKPEHTHLVGSLLSGLENREGQLRSLKESGTIPETVQPHPILDENLVKKTLSHPNRHIRDSVSNGWVQKLSPETISQILSGRDEQSLQSTDALTRNIFNDRWAIGSIADSVINPQDNGETNFKNEHLVQMVNHPNPMLAHRAFTALAERHDWGYWNDMPEDQKHQYISKMFSQFEQPSRYNNTEEARKEHVKHVSAFVKKHTNDLSAPEHLASAYRLGEFYGDSELSIRAMSHTNAPPELRKLAFSHRSHDVRHRAIMADKSMTTKELTAFAKKASNKRLNILQAVAKHPNASPALKDAFFEYALKHRASRSRTDSEVNDDYMIRDRVSDMYEHMDPRFIDMIASHPNVGIQKLIGDTELQNKLTPEHLDKLFSNPNVGATSASYAFDSGKTTDQHVDNIVRTGSPKLFAPLLDNYTVNPKVTKQHIATMIDRFHSLPSQDRATVGSYTIAGHSKFDAEHIDQILSHPNPDAKLVQHALANPKSTVEHHMKAATHSDPAVVRTTIYQIPYTYHLSHEQRAQVRTAAYETQNRRATGGAQ